MTSWLVWIVVAAIAVLLTATGYWFSVRTLRIVTLIIVLVLLISVSGTIIVTGLVVTWLSPAELEAEEVAVDP